MQKCQIALRRLMKFRITVSWLLVLCLVVGIPWFGLSRVNNLEMIGVAPEQVSREITPQVATRLIQQNLNNPSLVILDVRTPQEYADGHLDQAINVDFYSTDFPQILNRLDRQKTYLIYCHSGVRSSRSTELMGEMGFQQIYDLVGGIDQWQREGFATTIDLKSQR